MAIEFPNIDDNWATNRSPKQILQELRKRAGKPFDQLQYADWYRLVYVEAIAVCAIAIGTRLRVRGMGKIPALEKIAKDLAHETKTAMRNAEAEARRRTEERANQIFDELVESGITPELAETEVNQIRQPELNRYYHTLMVELLDEVMKPTGKPILRDMMELTLDHRDEFGKRFEALYQQLCGKRKKKAKAVAKKTRRLTVVS